MNPHELHDIADLDPDGLPTRASLLKAGALALAVAGVLLVGAVLPAEYGLDPTGVGGALGLTKLNAADAAPSASPAPDTQAKGGSAAPLQLSAVPLQGNTLTVPLAPHQGAEIKAVMVQGQSMHFAWRAEGGPVYVDMHGEPPKAPEGVYTSFAIAESITQAQGLFQAPFTGSHGWYWENRGDAPVTIHLKTSGFYETLYMP